MSVLGELYKKYGLEKTDMFPHAHYTIIKREGKKIEAQSKIKIEYRLHACTETYCAFECTATLEGKPPITMFASAMNSPKIGKSCNNFYLLEMAQKRALSRAILKACGFYTLGHYGEDEAEDFSKSNPNKGATAYNKLNAEQRNVPIVNMLTGLQVAKKYGDYDKATDIFDEAKEKDLVQVMNKYYELFENGKGIEATI